MVEKQLWYKKNLAKKIVFFKKGQKEMEFVKIGLFVYHMPTFFLTKLFFQVFQISSSEKNYLKRILVEKFIRAKKEILQNFDKKIILMRKRI